MSAMSRLRRWATALKQRVIAVYLAARDPRTPFAAKLVALMVAAYALSPIDLIPDFIPVLGYLDDLLLVPLGLWLAVRMIPAQVLADADIKAATIANRPTNHYAAAVIVALWCAAAFASYLWLRKHLG